MSVDQPIYGVDISDYQRGLDLDQVAREGYEFCVVKASEGPYADGTFYLNPSYGPQIHAAQAMCRLGIAAYSSAPAEITPVPQVSGGWWIATMSV